ncbi:MAG: UDP-3-O-(3-hydroxymyristoyl)glucosamine N-acyltransferase [Betaproteobacteria bacterium]|nr:UDP-3-O-(3-hydroxymyristoyl)glucosamine N-acyltransferase [Betaproteobacteria bacterium]
MRLQDIQAKLGGEAIGEAAEPLTGVGTLEAGRAGQVTFLANPRYRAQLKTTRASAVIVGENDRDATPLPRIVAANPYAYFARVAQLFEAPRKAQAGVHASALVHAGAVLHPSARVDEFASVAEGAVIGAHAWVGAGCVIGEGARVGEYTRLMPRVTVYARCEIGRRGLIHSGVVIGADGFGFAPDFRDDGGAWVKIPQTGRVIIGDDCEIGANSTIDRGAIEDTVIGNDVKIDNQVQIGHNCTVGDHTVISGCTGIAGSTRIGRRVMMGGASGAIGHLSICDGAVVSAMTLVTKSITEPGMVTGSLPHMKHADWLKNIVHVRRLDDLANAIKKGKS